MTGKWRKPWRRPVSTAEHVRRLVRHWRRHVGSEICQPTRERCAQELLKEFSLEDERDPGEEG